MRRYAGLVGAAVFGVLLTWRHFDPTFLSTRILNVAFLQWYYVALIASMYVAAWGLTPAFHGLVTSMARRGLVLPIVFILIIVGLLWFVDEVWNNTIAAWLHLSQWHLLDAFSSAFIGGS